MRPVLFPVAHELAGALRLVGLRDRLRCPECKRVGTFKPHGTWWDRWRDGDRQVRRWLCKWCGFYVGPEGTIYAFPSRRTGCWVLPGWTDAHGATPSADPLDVEKVPSAVVLEAYGRPINPWAG